MIYLKFHGGLGNQFFQYAYGRYLQQLLNDDVSYSFQNLEFEIERRIAIDHFNIDSSWKFIEYDEMYRLNKSIINYYTIREKIEGRLGLTIKDNKLTEHYLRKQTSYFKKGLFVQEGQAYIKPEKSDRKNKYVDGLWHHPMYSDQIRSLIVKELTLKNMESLPRTVMDNITSTESVAVHIRRGDYLNYPYYIVADVEYYKKAMRKMRQLHPEAQFFVFSDDIQWVKDTLNEDAIFIDGNNPDYIDMELMKNCKHFIISNSTFSWWAAYLGQSKNKTVMTPDKWYSDGRNKEWLNLPNWIVLETNV